VTLIDLTERTGHNGQSIRTIECSLCGATYGEDYKEFPGHLERDHGPGDVGTLDWSAEPKRGVA
jgi:hypothetical protein